MTRQIGKPPLFGVRLVLDVCLLCFFFGRGGFNMLSLLVIGVISFGVAFGVYIIESKRTKEREQQERDWQHFLATGDDKPFMKGAKE